MSDLVAGLLFYVVLALFITATVFAARWAHAYEAKKYANRENYIVWSSVQWWWIIMSVLGMLGFLLFMAPSVGRFILVLFPKG